MFWVTVWGYPRTSTRISLAPTRTPGREPVALQFVMYTDGADFLNHVEPYLLQNEAENNLTLGVAALSLPTDSDNLWASVSDGEQVVGTVFDTPPYKTVVTAAKDDVIDLLATGVHRIGRVSTGVLGPSKSALRFAEKWSLLAGLKFNPGMEQRIYRLARVIPPASTSGALRSARPDEGPLLGSWIEAFSEETGGLRTQPGLEVVQSGLEEGQMFVWDNGGPVSMAMCGRQTRNGATISAVYTPGNERARGYASACVAELSQRLLDEGREFCCLYADRANRTSNDIYLSIGYEPVCDVDEYAY